MDEEEREYICETCDRTETLSESQAYQSGWDYPPFIGAWGVVSPRTCPDCGIETTAYWALIQHEPLNDRHVATIKRIKEEVE